MPHIDELLGAATFVSAGLFAALSLQPINSGSAQATVADGLAATVAAAPESAKRVPCATDVVHRSGDASAIERAPKSTSECAAKDAAQPRA